MRHRSERSRTISRRHFLGALGAGAVASSVSSTLFARAVQAQTGRPRAFVLREDRFGRMFPNLDPFFRDNSSRLRAAMQDIGKLGGMMDAKDELGDGGKAAAIALIVDPDLSANNPNNPSQTAGSTFIGQFLDHDMTFDLTSRLAVVTEPSRPTSARPRSISTPSMVADRSRTSSSTSPYPPRAARGPRSSASSMAGASRICPAIATAARSSPIRATTRT
jgi:hypothetical protein